MDLYLALLQVGFTLPRRVTTRAVRSYRTLSPLPANNVCGRSTLCCTFRRLAPPRRYLAPCPVEPGLSSRRQRPAIARLTLTDSVEPYDADTSHWYCGLGINLCALWCRV